MDITHTTDVLKNLGPVMHAQKPGKMTGSMMGPGGMMELGTEVVNGLCTQDCWKFKVFIALFVVKGAIMGMSVPAMQQAQLR